jgi:hypothetical protein
VSFASHWLATKDGQASSPQSNQPTPTDCSNRLPQPQPTDRHQPTPECARQFSTDLLLPALNRSLDAMKQPAAKVGFVIPIARPRARCFGQTGKFDSSCTIAVYFFATHQPAAALITNPIPPQPKGVRHGLCHRARRGGEDGRGRAALHAPQVRMKLGPSTAQSGALKEAAPGALHRATHSNRHPNPNRRQWAARNLSLLLDKNPIVRRGAARALAALNDADPAFMSSCLASASAPELTAFDRAVGGQGLTGQTSLPASNAGSRAASCATSPTGGGPTTRARAAAVAAAVVTSTDSAKLVVAEAAAAVATAMEAQEAAAATAGMRSTGSRGLSGKTAGKAATAVAAASKPAAAAGGRKVTRAAAAKAVAAVEAAVEEEAPAVPYSAPEGIDEMMQQQEMEVEVSSSFGGWMDAIAQTLCPASPFAFCPPQQPVHNPNHVINQTPLNPHPPGSSPPTPPPRSATSPSWPTACS